MSDKLTAKKISDNFRLVEHNNKFTAYNRNGDGEWNKLTGEIAQEEKNLLKTKWKLDLEKIKSSSIPTGHIQYSFYPAFNHSAFNRCITGDTTSCLVYTSKTPVPKYNSTLDLITRDNLNTISSSPGLNSQIKDRIKQKFGELETKHKSHLDKFYMGEKVTDGDFWIDMFYLDSWACFYLIMVKGIKTPVIFGNVLCLSDADIKGNIFYRRNLKKKRQVDSPVPRKKTKTILPEDDQINIDPGVLKALETVTIENYDTVYNEARDDIEKLLSTVEMTENILLHTIQFMHSAELSVDSMKYVYDNMNLINFKKLVQTTEKFTKADGTKTEKTIYRFKSEDLLYMLMVKYIKSIPSGSASSAELFHGEDTNITAREIYEYAKTNNTTEYIISNSSQNTSFVSKDSDKDIKISILSTSIEQKMFYRLVPDPNVNILFYLAVYIYNLYGTDCNINVYNEIKIQIEDVYRTTASFVDYLDVLFDKNISTQIVIDTLKEYNTDTVFLYMYTIITNYRKRKYDKLTDIYLKQLQLFCALVQYNGTLEEDDDDTQRNDVQHMFNLESAEVENEIRSIINLEEYDFKHDTNIMKRLAYKMTYDNDTIPVLDLSSNVFGQLKDLKETLISRYKYKGTITFSKDIEKHMPVLESVILGLYSLTKEHDIYGINSFLHLTDVKDALEFITNFNYNNSNASAIKPEEEEEDVFSLEKVTLEDFTTCKTCKQLNVYVAYDIVSCLEDPSIGTFVKTEDEGLYCFDKTFVQTQILNPRGKFNHLYCNKPLTGGTDVKYSRTDQEQNLIEKLNRLTGTNTFKLNFLDDSESDQYITDALEGYNPHKLTSTEDLDKLQSTAFNVNIKNYTGDLADYKSTIQNNTFILKDTDNGMIYLLNSDIFFDKTGIRVIRINEPVTLTNNSYNPSLRDIYSDFTHANSINISIDEEISLANTSKYCYIITVAQYQYVYELTSATNTVKVCLSPNHILCVDTEKWNRVKYLISSSSTVMNLNIVMMYSDANRGPLHQLPENVKWSKKSDLLTISLARDKGITEFNEEIKTKYLLDGKKG